MKTILLCLLYLSLVACEKTIQNTQHTDLIFSGIKSDYSLTDTNNYACEQIDVSVLEHILLTGNKVTGIDIHNFYDTTGCNIHGQLKKNSIQLDFTFDYGGIFNFSDGTLLACGKQCCVNSFNYCSWSEDSLKGE